MNAYTDRPITDGGRGCRRSAPLAAAAACALVLCLAPAPLPAESLPKQIEELGNKLPELKVKETVINVSPKVNLYLPNGSFDLALEQKYRKTTIEFLSRYDLVDSFMGFSLDLLYDLAPLSLGMNLSDKVDFNEVLGGSEYLQRSQDVAPYAQYDLGGYTKLRGSLMFVNTYTDAVKSLLRIDQGQDVVGEVLVAHDTLNETLQYPDGRMVSLSVKQSFRNLGSDYEYAQAELNARTFVYPFDRNFIEGRFLAGYPLTPGTRPLTSYYTVGGYRMLRGYRFKEFRGEGLLYGALTYNLPIVKKDAELSLVTWDFFVEAANIGGKAVFSTSDNFKSSAGTGVGYRLVLFNIFPVHVEVAAAKAFENRAPLFYVTLSTIYYTWRN